MLGADANRHERRVGRVSYNAAGDVAFADERRGVTRRATIGADENFVTAAGCGATPGQAILADDPHGRAGCTLFALRAGRTGRADRAGGTGSAWIAFRPLWTGRSWVAFRPLPAAGEQHEQRRDNDQTPPAHFADPYGVLGPRRRRLIYVCRKSCVRE